MLDEVLPKAQAVNRDRFRILAQAQATKLEISDKKVKAIKIRLADGRIVSVHNPKTIVVSGGAIASSWLLMRSGIEQRVLPVVVRSDRY